MQFPDYLPGDCIPRDCIFLDFHTLEPRQNGGHFADEVFKWVFFNENVWISIKISLKFAPKGPINNILALIQKMEWLGTVQATSHYLNQ